MSRPEAFGARFVARFQEQRLVDRYHLRPTYPPEIFELLTALIVDEPRAILDIGCGPGNIARPLAPLVARVDAVDLSEAMLARGKTLPGGDAPNIHWLRGRAEDFEARPPYALITAGASLHWMDWDVVLPRMAEMLTERGVLAIAWVDEVDALWTGPYEAICQRYTTNPTLTSFHWRGELARRGLFQPLGERGRPRPRPCASQSWTTSPPSMPAAPSLWKP